MNERDSVSIYQGLSNAGFEITSKDWLSGYQKTYEKSREDWKQSIIDKSVKENMNVVMAYFATPLSSFRLEIRFQIVQKRMELTQRSLF
mgnify:CR=1 FL=1